MVQAPTNLSLTEDIPRVVASWTNNTTLSDYYTLIYRNQQNYLQGEDETNKDNHRIVGAARTGVSSFSDYGTDYETSYFYLTTSVTADVFALTDEASTTVDVDTFEWDESWDSVTWSQDEIGPLNVEDTSTLDSTLYEWDTNTWGLSWQTFENVEDEVILNKNGFKLSWSVIDKGEDLHFIYRSTTPGINKEDYELVGATKDNYFVDNGATPGEEYYYRVGYATITDESGSSNVASITTSVPRIDDDAIVTNTLSESIVGDDNSLSFDNGSIQEIQSNPSTFTEDSVARDSGLITDIEVEAETSVENSIEFEQPKQSEFGGSTLTFAETNTISRISGNNESIQNAADSQRISFNSSYNNPVIVAHMTTQRGAQPIDNKVTDITSTAATIFNIEPDRQGHNDEDHSYIVIEEGVNTSVEGVRVEAGLHDSNTFVVNGDSNPSGDTIQFKQQFDSTPIILATPNSHNSKDFSTVWINNVTKSSFDLAQMVDSVNNREIETIGWIAIESGVSGTFGGTKFKTELLSGDPFNYSFNGNPDVIVDLQQSADYGWVRGDGISETEHFWEVEYSSGGGSYGAIALDNNSTLTNTDPVTNSSENAVKTNSFSEVKIINAESVAFEQEIPTDAIATPTQTQETSNVLETPLLTQVNGAANESTDAIEITNAVTVVSSATATVSTVASTDESTSATDAAIKPSAEAQSSDSTEFSSNDDGGQITPSSVVSSDTPSVGFVTDGGVITATSTSNDTPSTGTAIEETGITAPILSSTVTSAETSSVSDTGTVTGEVETSVAPVSLALAQETPIPVDSQTAFVESTEFSTAGDGAATTTFSSVTREIDADSLAISSPDVATLTFSALESGEFAASIDEALIQEIAIVEIDAVETAIGVDSGIVDVQITSVVSADEFTQEFKAGETSSIVGNTIESSESTSAEELAIPESIDVFIFTTASDGIAIPPATLQEGVASSILSAETAFAGDDALVETLAASSIEIDAFTQSFEDNDITTEKAGTILATTDSLEETSSLSDVNSTSSSVSTLTSDNGFAAATDTGTLTVESEKSVISTEENTSALEEGTITSQSVDTLTSTEFTFSVDDAVVQTTNATSILSDDEFAQAITQPIATTVDILTAEQNAFALSSEADIIEGITSDIAESPSIGTSSTSGIQEFNASVAPIDAFTFSVDGEIQSQQIVDIEVNALTSALEEGILTAESVLTQEEDAFTLSNEFDRESPFTATIQEINAFTSAITAGFVGVDYLTKQPEDFTSSFEEGSITQVVGTAGTVAENIKFGDTAVARDAAGDEEMESLSLLQNAQSIAYEPSTNTDSTIETFEINGESFAEEEGSITEYAATSFDTPSTSIAREDNRETAASFDTEKITAQTTALEEGTRTETVASPIEVNAFASTVEEATITQKFAETSEAPTIGISVSQPEVTDFSSAPVDSFESIVATRNITLLTTETGTTSLTTRDPEVTRAFERSRQPDLKATPLVSPDEETSAIVKKSVLPVEMDGVVQDEFASAGDVPLVESMLAQTFGDGQAVVNQDLDELDLTTMSATIPQAGVGINPVVSPTSALFETFESEETFVITSFLAEPRIVAFSKQEDPLDAGAVRSPSSNVDDDDSESTLSVSDSSTSLEIRE